MSVGSVGALIDSHAAAYGVDPSLARAIAWQESGFNQNMVSATGAVGVMQLMPDTARWLGRDVLGRPFDPHDVDDNVEGGVAYLKWLTNRVGDSPEAIAAYYQGLDSVRRIGLYDDTQQYVRSVQSLRGTR
jgi:soluble lytic murein transglycosylase-like protein